MADASTADTASARNETRDDGAARPASPYRFSLRHWRAVLKRTFQSIGDDRIALTAAGMAFYALLAIFPALAAVISIWGLIAEPGDVAATVSSYSAVLPADVLSILKEQAKRVAGANEGGIGLALAVSLVIGFFSAARGVKAMMMALNIVYDEPERRGFFKFNAVAFAMTVAISVGAIVALAAIALVPIILGFAGLGAFAEDAIGIARWPILFLAAWGGIAALYRFAPSRENAEWKWISPAAGGAVVLWLAASVFFSVYVQNFASYNEVYGSIGAVVVLLMWFWASAFVFLIGAEVASEMEKQPALRGREDRAPDGGGTNAQKTR